jgi:hypothetical protein
MVYFGDPFRQYMDEVAICGDIICVLWGTVGLLSNVAAWLSCVTFRRRQARTCIVGSRTLQSINQSMLQETGLLTTSRSELR